jgi:hypothetical protein
MDDDNVSLCRLSFLLSLSLSESETEIKNQNRCGIFSFFFSIFW